MTALRSLLFVALFYLWSASVAILITPLLLAPRTWVLRALEVWSYGVIGLLRICDIRVEVRGLEHVPKGKALVAPKHQCMFDVFAQFAWLPDSCFVLKKELMWIPFFGWYAQKAGMIVVDREAQAAALKKLVRDTQERLQEDRQLVIFPEGTRGEPGVRGSYKPGIAALYRELNLPVHPVATNSGVHWPKHGFLRKPGVIVFEYLEPIPPGLKRAEFMRTLEERIESASMRLLEL
ncbi:1-acyl-sn-glycerol-3-phosphate acyltransferase [Phenylobacterium sp.]|uniref:lysophospholipid acyltransferase family protein n=1 Tax=Phenylobacterium sp. TaxID=1871053 RepID=UPI002731632C|nr:lysophospholipid acyltransferase family protein [Phenylobacterium sp.]MDP1875087.1 lysophospholipid acyltransferase family protein [Phenylobacterium sp.]MDP3489380.1 lysophospholipid acyltransferase family protein [Phenylobacterium sp.]